MKIFSSTIALVLAMMPMAAWAAQTKPTIVLVHGAFETSQVWNAVVSRLQHDGYAVTNVDLPGRPGNEMPMSAVTLHLYQQTVARAIANETQPVVLVGHSFGGFTIAAEAEAQPSKIKTLVFVAAYIPRSGDSLLTMATADKGSKLGPSLVFDKTAGFVSVAPNTGGALFANDAPAGVQSAVNDAIVNEPLAPLVTPVKLTAGRYGKVDKVAVRTLQDVVISAPFQVEMATWTPVRLQLTINTGHTPFITDPNRLADEIETAAQ